jgi:hypothetical protein
LNGFPPFPNSAQDEPEPDPDEPDYQEYDPEEDKGSPEGPGIELTIEQLRGVRGLAKVREVLADYRGDISCLGPLYSRAEVEFLVQNTVTPHQFDVISRGIDAYVMEMFVTSGIITVIARDMYRALNDDND